MENQINMGKNNTQQISQSPVSQPIQIPEKPKINYWMVLTIVSLVIIIPGGFYIDSLKKQLNSVSSSRDNKPEVTQVPTVITPMESPAPTTLKPTKGTDISDWKTYQSNKYNFEFKYPSIFTQKETLDSIYLESIPQKNTVSFAVDYFDDIIEQVKKLSEEEARQQSFSFLVSETEYKFGIGQLIRGKKIVLRRFLDSGGNYDEEIIYFKVGNHSFVVQTSDKKIRDQILSTLKTLN